MSTRVSNVNSCNNGLRVWGVGVELLGCRRWGVASNVNWCNGGINRLHALSCCVCLRACVFPFPFMFMCLVCARVSILRNGVIVACFKSLCLSVSPSLPVSLSFPVFLSFPVSSLSLSLCVCVCVCVCLSLSLSLSLPPSLPPSLSLVLALSPRKHPFFTG